MNTIIPPTQAATDWIDELRGAAAKFTYAIPVQLPLDENRRRLVIGAVARISEQMQGVQVYDALLVIAPDDATASLVRSLNFGADWPS